MEARGRDILSGLPKTVTINSVEALEALEEPVNMVIEAIKVTLENAPPEISADIVENGIILSGGSSLLKGFDKLIEMSTGIKGLLQKMPRSCGRRYRRKPIPYQQNVQQTGKEVQNNMNWLREHTKQQHHAGTVNFSDYCCCFL